MKYYLIYGAWLTAIACTSCQGQNQNGGREQVASDSFPYILKADAIYTMPSDLEEISGITFVKENANTLYAIQDEEGLLFEYNLVKKQVVLATPFAKKGDYEEITTDDEYFYVLKSDGEIFSFPVEHGTAALGEVTVNKGLVPKAEYESMAYDPSSGRVFLLCKVCKTDKKGGTVSGYILKVDSGGRLSNGDEFNLPINALSALDKRIKKTFKPSAMARRTSSNEWYILSSIDQALVITDDTFKPKEVIHLPRKIFEQPEGIAFDEHDNLYISSEAGRQKHGMIYKFNLIK